MRAVRAILATILLITAALSFGSLVALYTRDVTVKLLPFDNKSELSVMIDLPEGASVEATDRVAQDIAELVLRLPEVTSVQSHAATASPANFNGLVRHSYLRMDPQMGEVAVNLLPKSERDRTSHEVALDIRAQIAGLALPVGTSIKVVEPPPGPPVMATLLAEIGLEEPMSPADTIASLPAEIKKALQLDSHWLAEHLPPVADYVDVSVR